MNKSCVFVLFMVATLATNFAWGQPEKSENWAIEKIMDVLQAQETSEYGHKKVVLDNKTLITGQDEKYLMLLVRDTIQGTLEVFIDKFPAGAIDTSPDGSILSKGVYVSYAVTNYMRATGINNETALLYSAVSEDMMIELDFDPFFTNDFREEQQEYGAFGSSYWEYCLLRAGANKEDFLFSSLIEQVWSERSAARFAEAEDGFWELYDLIERMVRMNGNAIDKIRETNEKYQSRLEELAQKL